MHIGLIWEEEEEEITNLTFTASIYDNHVINRRLDNSKLLNTVMYWLLFLFHIWENPDFDLILRCSHSKDFGCFPQFFPQKFWHLTSTWIITTSKC